MAYSEPVILPFSPFPTHILPPGAANFTHPFTPNPLLFPPLPPNPNPNPTNSNQTLKTFSLFPTLPLELRQLVARHTLPLSTSRVVLTRPYAISERTRLHLDSPLTHKKSEFLFSSTSLPPVALWVNREFREEALRFYQLSFGFEHPSLQSQMYFEKKVVGKAQASRDDENENEENGDAERGDVLYFEFTGSPFYSNLGYFTATIMGEGCSRMDLSAVARIALSHKLVVGRQNAIRKLGRRLEVFEGLKAVVVVIERGVDGEIEGESQRPVGREARLVELGDQDGWDEETRTLVDEVEGAKAMWNALAWQDKKTGGLRKMPELKVMDIENLQARVFSSKRVQEVDTSAMEDTDENEKETVPVDKGRKMLGLGALARRFRSQWIDK